MRFRKAIVSMLLCASAALFSTGCDFPQQLRDSVQGAVTSVVSGAVTSAATYFLDQIFPMPG